MEKKILLAVVSIFAALLVACSTGEYKPYQIKKEGIEPYPISKESEYALYMMRTHGKIFSFKAPKAASRMKIFFNTLTQEGTWHKESGGEIQLDPEREPADQLWGNMSLQVDSNQSIGIFVETNATSFYTNSESDEMGEYTQSVFEFLETYQSIELGKEIPIALLVYDDGSSMRTYELSDFNQPDVFEGMDSVRVVTLEFAE